VSFILARFDPATRHYTSYTTRNVTTPANSPRPGVKAVQASADSNGQWTSLGSGRYTYKFNTVLPADYDKTKTHTLGFYPAVTHTEIGKITYLTTRRTSVPTGRTSSRRGTRSAT
jgi:hypothetical protein